MEDLNFSPTPASMDLALCLVYFSWLPFVYQLYINCTTEEILKVHQGILVYTAIFSDIQEILLWIVFKMG